MTKLLNSIDRLSVGLTTSLFYIYLDDAFDLINSIFIGISLFKSVHMYSESH